MEPSAKFGTDGEESEMDVEERHEKTIKEINVREVVKHTHRHTRGHTQTQTHTYD